MDMDVVDINDIVSSSYIRICNNGTSMALSSRVSNPLCCDVYVEFKQR
jgi:hypothetical protein